MDPQALAALSEALRCVYRVRATYEAALDRFGDVEPFVHLAESGQRQIDALRQLYQRKRVEPPSDRWTGQVELPQTLERASNEAIDAETETANTCERLLDQVEDPVVRMILSRLEEATRYQRLPLLRRSLERRQT